MHVNQKKSNTLIVPYALNGPKWKGTNDWKVENCTNKIDPKNNTHIPFTKGEGVHIFTYNHTRIWIYFISLLKAKKHVK
jgi:hypothetical protein